MAGQIPITLQDVGSRLVGPGKKVLSDIKNPVSK